MNMDYELAKELKEAGFPQESGDGCYFPTLEELIEACGGTYFDLMKAGDAYPWLCKGGDQFTAVVGDTAIEAVARLWLALNNKVDERIPTE